MSPNDYLKIFARRWGVILATVVVAVGVGWLTTLSPVRPAVRSYEATSVVLQAGAVASEESLNLNTVASLATLQPVANRVARSLEYVGDPLDLAEHVEAVGDMDRGLLYITATSTDREEVQLLADSFARQLIGYLNAGAAKDVAAHTQFLLERMSSLNREIEGLERRIPIAAITQTNALLQSTQADNLLLAKLKAKIFLLDSFSQQYEQLIAQGAPTIGLQVVQKAGSGTLVPEEGLPILGSDVSRLALAGALGLLLGMTIALVLERFDTRIRTKEAAEESFSLPVLAEIPSMPRRRRRKVIAAAQPTSAPAEAFRMLGAEVATGASSGTGDGARGRSGKPPQVLLVTSPSRAEGKTTVVANLAAALAETGKRVLVMSCDLHHPDVHRFFGVPNQHGLVDALRSPNGSPILQGVTWDTPVHGVWVVPSGASPEKPGELLSSEAMRDALAEARRSADVILLDTAPILSASDAAYLMPEIDAVLVVARAGSTTAELAGRTTGLLKRLGAPVVGVTLNAR